MDRFKVLYLTLACVSVLMGVPAEAKDPKAPNTILGASLSDDAQAFFADLAKTVVPERMKKYEEGRRKLGATYPALTRPFDLPLFVYATDPGKKDIGPTRTYYFAVASEDGSRPSITFQSGTKVAGSNWVLGSKTSVKYNDFGNRSKLQPDGNSLLRMIQYGSLGSTPENMTKLRQYASFLINGGYVWEAMAVISHMHSQYRDQQPAIELFVQEWMEWTALEVEFVQIGSGWFSAILPTEATPEGQQIRKERMEAYDAWVNTEASHASFMANRTLNRLPLSGKGKPPTLDKLHASDVQSAPGYDLAELQLFVSTVMKDGSERGTSTLVAPSLVMAQARYPELKKQLEAKPKDKKLLAELEANIFHWEEQLQQRDAAAKEAYAKYRTLNAEASVAKNFPVNSAEYFKKMEEVALAMAQIVPMNNTKKAIEPLDPNNGFYYYEMAEIYFNLAGVGREGRETIIANEKHGKEAVKYYEIALKYMHNQYNILMRLGRLQSAIGELGLAIKAFEVVEKDPFASDSQRKDAARWKDSVQTEATNNARQRDAKNKGIGGK